MDTVLNGIRIPKDCMIIIPHYAICKDDEIFENPETFDPKRFLAKKDVKNSMFMPFAAGPRNCLGMRFALLEMKICLIYLIRDFKVLISKQTMVR